MSIHFITFDINLNHIFFFLIFVSYFIRECIIYLVDKMIEDKTYSFGKTKNATRKLFNLYIYTISNLISFIFVLIIKYRSKRKYLNKKQTSNKKKTSKELEIEYIYNGDLPINRNQLLLRTLILTIFDFIAQFCMFLLYFFINDDKKFNVKDRFDISCIVNILSKFLLSRVFLKTYFYKHHFLSLGINVSFLIILSIFEMTEMHFTLINILYLLFRMFSTICYSLEDIVGKKVLIEEFLSPYSLLVYKGLYELFILLICSIPFLFIKRDDEIIFAKMIVLINNAKIIILNISLMIANFVYNIFIWIIIDRFSPNDQAMVSVIEGITLKLFILIFETNKFIENLSISIITVFIYFILIIGVCIHNEIIIINKCGLNEYTKKRLCKKGDEDLEQTKSQYSEDSINSFNDYSRRPTAKSKGFTVFGIEMVDKTIKLNNNDNYESHSKSVSQEY